MEPELEKASAQIQKQLGNEVRRPAIIQLLQTAIVVFLTVILMAAVWILIDRVTMNRQELRDQYDRIDRMQGELDDTKAHLRDLESRMKQLVVDFGVKQLEKEK